MAKKVTGFYVRPLTSRGDKMLGAKLEITVKGARGGPLTSTTSKTSGEAYFPLSGSIKAGDTIIVKVDGKEGITETIPAEHPTQSQPTLEFKVGGSASSPKAEEHHDDHKDAHHEEAHAPHRSENALVLNIVDGKSADIYSAVVHVKEFPDEVYTYGDKDEEIVINDPFGKPVTLLVTAPGFKGATVKLDPRERSKLIILESDVKKAAPVDWHRVLLMALVIAVVGVIGFIASQMGSSAQGLIFNPTTTASTDPIAQSIIKYSTWAAIIVVIVGRARLGQWSDVLSAGVFVVASFLAEWLSGLDAVVVSALPEKAASIITALKVIRWVVYALAIFWMYREAWANTPDLSMPGAIWDLISLKIFTSSNRMGLPISLTIGQVPLALGLKVFAALHYLLDMFQVPQIIQKKKDAKPKMESLLFGIATIVLFVVGMVFMNPGIAVFVVLLIAGLFSEMLEEITKNVDLDRAPTQLGQMIRFTKTNKADGVLFASFLINLLGWFGVWTYIYTHF